jgi:hypothetical protein
VNGKKNLDFLRPETARILRIFIDKAPFLKNYVLVGGSALAFHLRHRKSEDLDFFTYSHKFDKSAIVGFLNHFPGKEIINETEEQIDLLCEGIKVTFFNAHWDFLKPDPVKQFNIASLEDIAAMKIHVLFLRARYRDYYDVYFIVKEKMTLDELFNHAQRVVEGLTYKLFCIALTYIDDIEDDSILHLEPRENISKKEIRSFFEKTIS